VNNTSLEVVTREYRIAVEETAAACKAARRAHGDFSRALASLREQKAIRDALAAQLFDEGLDLLRLDPRLERNLNIANEEAHLLDTLRLGGTLHADGAG
jgi:hypothetical protein